MVSRYLSVLSNFGCHYTCPYCIVKNTGIDIPKTTLEGLDKLAEKIKEYDCNWVSISGGGDPLFEFNKHLDWWNKFFDTIPKGVKTELHTSYTNAWMDEAFAGSFDRIVYHCRYFGDIRRIHKIGEQIVRVVFVVHEKFTHQLIDDIVAIVKAKSDIDELSFRQMVDEDYNPTYYCYNKLKAGHGKDWYYILQNDYNLYYVEGEVSTKYEDFRKPVATEDEEPSDIVTEEMNEMFQSWKRKLEE